MSLFSEINSKIKGRVALLSEAEAEALFAMVAIDGDHVDLGTLWGGTAILAALAKREVEAYGKVYTIDYMQGGYWETGDPSAEKQNPTEAAIHENLARFGVTDVVEVVKANSYPWPLSDDVEPTSVLIDCDHSYEGCLRDWEKVRSLQPLFVAFHDYNHKTHPGVAKVVDEIKASDDLYKFSEQVGTLAVFMLQEPEPEPVTDDQAEDWSFMTVEELKDELRLRDLPIKGKKAELVERLEDVYA